MGMTANDRFVLRLWLIFLPIAMVALPFLHEYAYREREKIEVIKYTYADEWKNATFAFLFPDSNAVAMESNAAVIGFPVWSVSRYCIPVGLMGGFALPSWICDWLIKFITGGGMLFAGGYAAWLKDIRELQLLVPVAVLSTCWGLGMALCAIVSGMFCCERVSDTENAPYDQALARIAATTAPTTQLAGFQRLWTGVKHGVDAMVLPRVDSVPIRSSLVRTEDGEEGRRRRLGGRRVSFDASPHLVAPDSPEQA
jgi:hypothetical protein